MCNNTIDDNIETSNRLIDVCNQISHIHGSMKLVKQIQSELAFLKKIRTKPPNVQESHLKGTNLPHYTAVVHAALTFPNVTAVLKTYSTNQGKSLVVDVVAGQGHIWVKVVARHAHGLHISWSGAGQYGERDIVNQAVSYLECSTQHPTHFCRPCVYMCFYNGVTQDVASELNSLGVHFIGELILHDCGNDGFDTKSWPASTGGGRSSHHGEQRTCNLCSVPRRRLSESGDCVLGGGDENITTAETVCPATQIMPNTDVNMASRITGHGGLSNVRGDLPSDDKMIEKSGDIRRVGGEPCDLCDDKSRLSESTRSRSAQMTSLHGGVYTPASQAGCSRLKENNQVCPDDVGFEHFRGVSHGVEHFPGVSHNIEHFPAVSHDIEHFPKESHDIEHFPGMSHYIEHFPGVSHDVEQLKNEDCGSGVDRTSARETFRGYDQQRGSCVREDCDQNRENLCCSGSIKRLIQPLQCSNWAEDERLTFDETKKTANLSVNRGGAETSAEPFTGIEEILVIFFKNSKLSERIRGFTEELAIFHVSDIDRITNERSVNLDITALVALVSSLSHGHAHFIFHENVLTMQAQDERKNPVLERLTGFLADRPLFVCQSAWKDYSTILAKLAGVNETRRSGELESKLTIIPDAVSPRVARLDNSGRINSRSKAIFGTGDQMAMITVTANTGFIRAASKKGVELAVFVHQARALTEQKESTATIIPDNVGQ